MHPALSMVTNVAVTIKVKDGNAKRDYQQPAGMRSTVFEESTTSCVEKKEKKNTRQR
jgi:hypothetical protein